MKKPIKIIVIGQIILLLLILSLIIVDVTKAQIPPTVKRLYHLEVNQSELDKAFSEQDTFAIMMTLEPDVPDSIAVRFMVIDNRNWLVRHRIVLYIGFLIVGFVAGIIVFVHSF